MANSFRNEKEIDLNGRKITLRPTFENMSNFEGKVGSIAYVAYKWSQFSVNLKNLPTLSELTMTVYYFQAAHDKDFSGKLLTLNEVFDLVCEEGVFKALTPLLEFLANCTAGNKAAPDVSASEKKS